MASSSEVIKRDIEPLIYLFVDEMVFIANLLGCTFLLQGFYLSGGSVLVSSAYE